MSRIVVCLIALLLVACAPTPEPAQSEASLEPFAASQNPVLPSLVVIPTAPPQHSSDSTSIVLRAFRAIGIELLTGETPAENEGMLLNASADEGNISITLQAAPNDTHQLLTAGALIESNADGEVALEVREAFAGAMQELTGKEEAAEFFSGDLTAESGTEALTVTDDDGRDYQLTRTFNDGQLELSVLVSGVEMPLPSEG